jgi:hypothetical protein
VRWVSTSDKGAVTAETMLAFPALIALFASALGLVSLGLKQIRLEFDTFQFARGHSYGLSVDPGDEYVVEQWASGALSCIQLRRPGPIVLRSDYCVLKAGT